MKKFSLLETLIYLTSGETTTPCIVISWILLSADEYLIILKENPSLCHIFLSQFCLFFIERTISRTEPEYVPWFSAVSSSSEGYICGICC